MRATQVSNYAAHSLKDFCALCLPYLDGLDPRARISPPDEPDRPEVETPPGVLHLIHSRFNLRAERPRLKSGNGSRLRPEVRLATHLPPTLSGNGRCVVSP